MSKRALVRVRTSAVQILLRVETQTYKVEFQPEAVGALCSWLPWFPGWLGPAAFDPTRDACRDGHMALLTIWLLDISSGRLHNDL